MKVSVVPDLARAAFVQRDLLKGLEIVLHCCLYLVHRRLQTLEVTRRQRLEVDLTQVLWNKAE